MASDQRVETVKPTAVIQVRNKRTDLGVDPLPWTWS
jgi:hypothetical protein